MNLGKAIIYFREAEGLSQGDLARCIGISRTSMCQIEKNIKRPSLKHMEKICKKLKAPEGIIYVFALEQSDIPKSKRIIFNELMPSIQKMLLKITTE